MPANTAIRLALTTAAACSCSTVGGCLQPDLGGGFAVCWEVLVPTSSEGNLVAEIYGVPPGGMYGSVADPDPSNGVLRMYASPGFDAQAVPALEAIEYVDPSGSVIRIVFAEATTSSDGDSSPAGSRSYASIDGFLLRFELAGSEEITLATWDPTTQTASSHVVASESVACATYGIALEGSAADQTLEARACFVGRAFQCVVDLVKRIDATGRGATASGAAALENGARFSSLACEQISSIPVEPSAALSATVDLEAWIVLWGARLVSEEEAKPNESAGD